MLSAALAAVGVPALAQHEGHGQHGARPQEKPKPSASPQASPSPAPDDGGKHDAHRHAPAPPAGPEKSGAPESPAPTSAPAPPAAKPDAGSEHQGHSGAGVHQHSTGTATGTPAAPAAPSPRAEGAGGEDHSTHAGAGLVGGSRGGGRADANELMVVSGGGMGIRVGTSASNFIRMGQMGSGTSWQPASSPLYMLHKRSGEWLLMIHGEAKLGVNRQGGPRGVTKFESQNWLMPMAFRRVGRGTLALRGMFSLEPLTFSGAGSPQLFQTGEVYKGRPLVDFQHPHDLLMELSAQYTMPVGERGTWYTYLGFPGEPALGPVAFMHRMSASENPTAPLSHHLQDSTHISFGVLTSGFTYRGVKFEGSLFNGREPDDKRYNLEFNPWNSRSARVSYAPDDNWTVQYSYGLLKNPEFFERGDTHRQTASVQYNRPLARGNWATSLVWGRNREQHEGETFRLNSYLAESTLNFLDKNYVYTRLELVDREGDDLLSHDELHGLGFGDDAHPRFRIGAYTFGGARDLVRTDTLSMALGGDFTFYSKPDVLDGVYGRNPTSFKIFFRVRPAKMRMDEHAGHGGN